MRMISRKLIATNLIGSSDVEGYSQIQNKIEACIFHLNNQETNTTMKIKFVETPVQHADHPKYLGVTLDRSLT
jgi:hypothetical protein